MTISALAFAEFTQKGRVIMYVGKPERIVGKNISLRISGAESVQTDDEGRFEFHFLHKKSGDPIADIIVETPGYILVNRDQLHQWQLSRSNVMELVLCEERMYNIIHTSNLKMVKEHFRKTYVDADGNLGVSFDYNMENLDTYVADFTTTHMMSDDELNARIYRLFKDGKVEEALSIYEKSNLIKAYKESESYQHQNAIRAAIRAHINLLGMSANPSEYEKSFELSKQFYQANPGNDYVALKYAERLFTLGRYDESADIYKRLKKSKNKHVMAMAVASYANILLSKGDYMTAIAEAKRGLSVFRDFIDKSNDPDLYLHERCVLNSVMMLACAYYAEMPRAITYMDEAMTLVERLYEISSFYYGRQYAMTLNNACVVCANAGLTEKGKEFATKSIEICKKLYSRSRDRDANLLGKAYLMMANMLNDSTTFDESEKYYIRAERIYEECSLNNPESYKGLLATCYQNHSVLYLSDIDKYRDKAKAILERSRTLLESTYFSMPDLTAYPLAMTYHNLYMIYDGIDNNKALDFSKKCLTLAETLYSKSHDAFLPFLGMSQYEYARCLAANRQYEEALKYYTLSLNAMPNDSVVLKEIEEIKAKMK